MASHGILGPHINVMGQVMELFFCQKTFVEVPCGDDHRITGF